MIDETVLRAFDSLSRADRELLALVAWDGLSTRQVATMLGTTAVAARVRLHRARRRLAAALDLEEARSIAPRPSPGVAQEVP